MRHRLLLLLLSVSSGVLYLPLAMTQSIQLPDIGDPASVWFSADEERKLSLDILRRLRERDAVLDDRQLNEYLNSIGQRIAAYAEHNGVPYTFFMVRDSSINAFALPYHFIGINAGLLLATDREDELAGVIAHEVAHVSQRHIARAIADMKRLSLPIAAAVLAGAMLAAAGSHQAGSAAVISSVAAGTEHQISFTRANEQEADRIGMQLLAKAGFDPRGMTDFFTKLERLSRSEAHNQLPDMLRTHPRPESRAADTQDRLPPPPIRQSGLRDRQAYDLAKARALVLLTEDHQTLIRELGTRLAKGDFPNEGAGRYAYAMVLRQAGRYDEAQQQLQQAQQHDPDRLAFRIEAAEIALAKGDRVQATRLFEEALQLYPDDRTLAMHYGQALARQGDPKRAMQLLYPHLRRRPNDAPLYLTYAQAAERAGDRAETYAMMAEYHYLNGELQAALEQLELGLRSSNLSPNQEARLRARLKQLQAEVRAQEFPVSKKNPP